MEDGKVLFIIAPKDFRDEELFETKKILEAAGWKTEIASIQKGKAQGMLGGEVEIDKELPETVVADYQAVVFVGGRGATCFFEDPIALDLAREAHSQGKVVAAICIAPSILANAGVLNGKRATAYPSEEENLKEQGAIFVEKPVVADGKIVTGRGPEAASKFAWKIVELLQS